MLASFSLFFLDLKLDYFIPVRTVLSTIVYPLQVVVSLPSDLSDWADEFFKDRKQLREKNRTLEATNLLNNFRLQRLQTLESENTRLRELLGSSFRLHEHVLVAELLTIDLDPFSQQVVIDKGRNYGVFPGQSVLDATGVMGQVTKVNAFSSRVILLTDPNHGIPIQINRNGLRAVATGRGLGEYLQLEHLPHNADIREGDLLVTSGLGGRYPEGYPVGTVVSIRFPQGKSFAEVAVKPSAHLSTSHEVLLVLSSEKTEVDNNGGL